MIQIFHNREILIVLISLLIQIPLAIFLGHYYDQKIAISAGYLVSQGLSPYQISDLKGVFPHPLLNGIIPGIGYPPLWPLILGAIYKISYGITQNIYLYNFMIKVPIIIANFGLAYLIKDILSKTKGSQIARFAWIFVLFNPLMLLLTIGWGSIESIVAFLSLSSLLLAERKRMKASAALMALSIIFKPVSLPLVGLPLFLSSVDGFRKKAEYLLILSVVGLVGFFGPFLLFNWSLPWGADTWNAQFRMIGGLTPFNIIEVFQSMPVLPVEFSFLGFIWVPALIIGYYFLSLDKPKTIIDLAKKGAALTLIFYLTRLWLSETNLVLVIVLMLLALKLDKSSFRSFRFLWIVPLVFLVVNWALPQLFFLPFPSILASLAEIDKQIGLYRFILRFALSIVWQILAWALVIKLLKPPREKQLIIYNE